MWIISISKFSYQHTKDIRLVLVFKMMKMSHDKIFYACGHGFDCSSQRKNGKIRLQFCFPKH
jgi:hypothetical protein